MADFDDDPESFGIERPMGRVFADIAAERLSRRALLGGVAAAGLAAALPAEAQTRRAPLRFADATSVLDANDHWSPGYKRQIVVRWGDPIFADSPAFDPERQTGAAQARQFGYNCDYVGLTPMPGNIRLPLQYS